MKRTIVLLLASFLILTSCTRSYEKRFDDLYDDVSNQTASFSSLQKEYETLKNDLVFKLKELDDTSDIRDLSEKEYEEYYAVSGLLDSIEDEIDRKIYFIGFREDGTVEEKREIAQWLYNWTSWEGPYVTVRLGDEQIKRIKYSPSAETIDLSDVVDTLNDRGLILKRLHRPKYATEYPDLSQVNVYSPFEMSFDVECEIPLYFDTQSYPEEEPFTITDDYFSDITIPFLDDVDNTYFYGWGKSKGDYIVIDYWNTKYNIDSEDIILAGRTVSPSSFTDRAITLYALYYQLDVSEFLIWDSTYSNGRNINPGETVRLLPIIKNTGTIKTEITDVAVGEVDEDTAKWAKIRQEGSFVPEKSPLYPGQRMAIGDSRESKIENEKYSPWDSVDIEDSSSYIEMVISKDTPSGTILNIPMIIEDINGLIWNISVPVSVDSSDFGVSLNAWKFADSGNKDGMANPGETIYLDVILASTAKYDTGNSTVTTLSTDSPYVSFIRNTMKHSFIKPGDYANSYHCDYGSYNSALKAMNLKSNSTNNFAFTISNDCSSGTRIPFTLTTIDNAGTRAVNKFELEVKDTDSKIILVKSPYVEYKGDGDGTVNPGETISLDLLIKNTGSSTLANPVLEIYAEEDVVGFDGAEYWTNAAVENDEGEIKSGLRFQYTEIASGKYCNSRYYNSSNEDTLEKSYNYSAKVRIPNDWDVTRPLVLKWRVSGDGTGKVWKGEISIPVSKVRSEMAYYGYWILDSDENGDGQVSPSENVGFSFAAKNVGTVATKPLTFSVRSESPYIRVVNPGPFTSTNKVGAEMVLSSNKSIYKEGSVRYSSNPSTRLVIADDVPEGTIGKVIVTYSDGINSWEIPFIIQIVSPDTVIDLAGYSFIDTGDYDGNPDIGEKVTMDIRLFNSGSAKAKDVKVSLSSDYERVMIINDSYTFSEIDSKNYRTIRGAKYTYTSKNKALLGTWGHASEQMLSFFLSEGIEPGTSVNLMLTVEDKYENRWEYPITFIAEEPVLPVGADISINNKKDGEGIRPGESVAFLIGLKNEGETTQYGLKVDITSDSPYVENNMTFTNYKDMKAGASKRLVGTGEWGVGISPDAVIGESITFDFRVYNASGVEKVYTKTWPIV